jgi:hypothetical protein
MFIQRTVESRDILLPAFRESVWLALAQKTRTSFLPGSSNRNHLIDCLFDDLVRRKLW